MLTLFRVEFVDYRRSPIIVLARSFDDAVKTAITSKSSGSISTKVHQVEVLADEVGEAPIACSTSGYPKLIISENIILHTKGPANEEG